MMLLFLFILQTILILVTKVNIYPELFYFPWLVAQGQVPYIDFFDHHGFLLYYLLAPLAVDTSLKMLVVAHYILQTATLVLTYAIFRNTLRGLSLFLAGLLYVLLNFYVVGGNVWYESFISFCYVCVLYVLLKDSKYSSIAAGLCIAAASMIKPTSAAILIPTVVYTRSLYVVLVVGLSWLPVFAYYFVKNSLLLLFDNLISFNSFFAHYMLERKVFFMKQSFLTMNGTATFVGAVTALYQSKARHVLLAVAFFLSALIHVVPRFEYNNLIPAVPFACLLIAWPLAHFRQAYMRRIYTAFVSLVIMYVGVHIYNVFPWMQSRTTYIETQPSCDVYENVDAAGSDSFYVFANNPELYFLKNQPPHLYHPLIYPWYTTYYPHLETKVIADLERQNVRYVYVPTIPDERFKDLHVLKSYIQTHYTIKETNIPCVAQLEGV